MSNYRTSSEDRSIEYELMSQRNKLWRDSDDGLRSTYVNLCQRMREAGLRWHIPLLPIYPFPRTFATMAEWREQVATILRAMEDAIGEATAPRRAAPSVSRLDYNGTVQNIAPKSEVQGGT